MPLVEPLPNSASVSAPGWTYVVDTGYDPSKIAINPKDRKRATARAGAHRGDNELSARQQTAIARRIAELERDNDPKQSIPIPGAGRTAPKTSNAKKILQSQRQIKHWLDEEEALAQQAPPSRPPVGGRSGARVPPRLASMNMGSVPATPGEATPGPSASGAQTPALPPPASTTRPSMPQQDALFDITADIPAPLAQNELQTLLSAPPLSYGASHAAPPAAGGPPQRHFCDNCGYWGKIKCLKCGARVCGLECKDSHESTRCLKWA